jgi:hypothetical protein
VRANQKTDCASIASNPCRFVSVLEGGGPGGVRLAAAAAIVRQEVQARSARDGAIRDVSAGVAGPFLTAYVLWLLFDAQARGIERLYFLSRDGEVLLGLADILAPRLGITIERRYLYASRRAWNCAAPQPGKAPAQKPDTGENRQLVLDYLEQEGVFDAVPKAMVDLGGQGSQYVALCALLKEKGAQPCPLYLIGASAFSSPVAGLRRGFYFDDGDGTGAIHRTVPGFGYILKVFSSTEHGTLIGFRREDGRIVPKLAASRGGEMRLWGLPVLRGTVAAFARAVDLEGLDPDDLDPSRNAPFRGMIDRLLEAFWLTPTFEEAGVWGSFLREMDSRDIATMRPLATPFTLGDLLAFWRRGPRGQARTLWMEGSLVMTPRPLRVGMLMLHKMRKRIKGPQPRHGGHHSGSRQGA